MSLFFEPLASLEAIGGQVPLSELLASLEAIGVPVSLFRFSKKILK